jgi:hypothetical protein
MSSEICKNCNHIIGNLEQAFVFNGNIICSGCYNALSAAEDKQVIPAIKKSLQITCLWIGIGAIILLCLFPPWEVYLSEKMHDGEGGSTTSYEHHWCNWDTNKMFEHIPGHRGANLLFFSGRATIAYGRLVVECAIVAIVTGGLFVTIGSFPKKANLLILTLKKHLINLDSP